MISKAFPLFAAIILSTLCLNAQTASSLLTDSDLARLVKERKTALRQLTSSPLHLPPLYSSLCAPPYDLPHSPHDIAFVHVYMSTNKASVTKTVNQTYPVGTIVLKEKLPSIKATQAELFTGMLKREKGYNPKAGDWEFFTVSGDAKTITSRGKTDSCIDCHSQYKNTDYVTEIWKKSAAK